MSIDNRVVGAAITQLRLRQGMTQLQLASTLNVSHQAVSKWEKGAALPDIQTLLALTQLFGLSVEQLLLGEIPAEDDTEFEEEEFEAIEAVEEIKAEEETVIARETSEQEKPQEESAENAYCDIEKEAGGVCIPEEDFPCLEEDAQTLAQKTLQSVVQFGEEAYRKAGVFFEKAEETAKKAVDYISEVVQNEAGPIQSKAEEALRDVKREAKKAVSNAKELLFNSKNSAACDEAADEVILSAEIYEEDVPQEDIPQEDIPQADIPQEDIPQEDIPEEEIPEEEIPQEEIPQAEADPSENEDAPVNEGAKKAQSINLRQLIQMAPFMSREKLTEIVLDLEELNMDDLVRIAPFLSKSTVEILVMRALENAGSAKSIDSRSLLKLAPFIRTETLFTIITKNIQVLDWHTIRRLAPFLKSHMVDELTDYLRFGKSPSIDPVTGEKNETIHDTISNTYSDAVIELQNVVTEVGNAVSSFFRSGKNAAKANRAPEKTQEEPICEEAPEVSEKPCAEAPKASAAPKPESVKKPSEFKDKVARAALENGSWEWLDAHLSEIGDPALLGEVAKKAVSIGDPSGIAVRAASAMTDETLADFFDYLIEVRAWETAIALRNKASAEISGRILEKASLASGADRENAYNAIEFFASKAPRETLEEITERAIREDNWVLINALTDAF
ncbi:MAG: helix-turn-helix transcriptional regulator [Clostridia bacterium]|nr:helix-turn-helix transcriptional regulator [Clostridia bacterium]